MISGAGARQGGGLSAQANGGRSGGGRVRSVTDFLRQLIPADPVPDVGAKLPLHALGHRLGELGELAAWRERIVAGAGRG